MMLRSSSSICRSDLTGPRRPSGETAATGWAADLRNAHRYVPLSAHFVNDAA